MDELARAIADARQVIDPAWSDARTARVASGIARVRQRRRIAGGIAGLVLVVAIGMAGRYALNGHAPQIELADGSTAMAVDKDTEIQVVTDVTDEVVIVLKHGRARFDVRPSQRRIFRVQAGEVVVEVIGTAFEVALTTDNVIVSVSRGRVKTHARSGEHALSAGESFTFSRVSERAVVPEPAAVDTSEQEDSNEAPSVDANAPKASSAHDSRWRALAREGRFEEAYVKLQSVGRLAVRDVAQELSEAADTARLSGHPRDAMPYLRTIVKRHAKDPLAPLAAFTMGRILLDQLGEPRSAAAAFVDAQRLAPGGSLTEDALAREIEAWAKAGEADKARERAEHYVATYPNGVRTNAVRGFGGLQ